MIARRLVAAAAAGLVAALTFAAPAAATGPAQAPEYWFDAWQVPQLWAGGARGQGVTIAEIDTGVNAALPELAGNVVPGIDLGAAGGNGETDRQVNPFGHGTAMASLMVARPGLLDITGIAPDAKLLPIAVPLTGTSDSSPDDHLAAAIRYAADHGAKIISMSLGGTRKASSTDEPCPSDEQQAIYYALARGAILFAAVGNNGRSGNAVDEPGVCLGVVAVGAVDRSGTVAAFSSREPYVTLTAPGVDIPTLGRVPGQANLGRGTSQATAITSAAAALVWSKYPTSSGRQILARILATLDEHRTTASPAYGYGLLDAQRAVTAGVPADAPNPVYAAVAPFLARYRARRAPAALPTPARAGSPHPASGRFAVGSPPRTDHAAVPAGVAVAAAGVLALILLALWPLTRRRRAGRGQPGSAR